MLFSDPKTLSIRALPAPFCIIQHETGRFTPKLNKTPRTCRHFPWFLWILSNIRGAERLMSARRLQLLILVNLEGISSSSRSLPVSPQASKTSTLHLFSANYSTCILDTSLRKLASGSCTCQIPAASILCPSISPSPVGPGYRALPAREIQATA